MVVVKSIDIIVWTPMGKHSKRGLVGTKVPSGKWTPAFKSLHHPFYCQCYHGSISVINIIIIIIIISWTYMHSK